MTKKGGCLLIVDFKPKAAHALEFNTRHEESDFFEPTIIKKELARTGTSVETEDFGMWYLVKATKLRGSLARSRPTDRPAGPEDVQFSLSFAPGERPQKTSTSWWSSATSCSRIWTGEPEERRIAGDAFRIWARKLMRKGKFVCFIVEAHGRAVAGGCVWLRETQPVPGFPGGSPLPALHVYRA